MLVESYDNGAATEAIARASGDLTGLEACALSVLHPPGVGRMVCLMTGFGNGIVVVRTSLRLSHDSLVQISIGHAIIIFGTVRTVSASGSDAGFLSEIAVTSAFIRQTGAPVAK